MNRAKDITQVAQELAAVSAKLNDVRFGSKLPAVVRMAFELQKNVSTEIEEKVHSILENRTQLAFKLHVEGLKVSVGFTLPAHEAEDLKGILLSLVSHTTKNGTCHLASELGVELQNDGVDVQWPADEELMHCIHFGDAEVCKAEKKPSSNHI